MTNLMWKKIFGPPDIVKLRTQGNIGGLLKALDHPGDFKIRRDAALALGDLRASIAVDSLLILLQEDNADESRRAAALALSQIRAEKAYLPLVTSLQDPDPGVRRIAVFGLGQLGNSKAIPFLSPFLADDDLRTRRTAVKALQRLGWQPEQSRTAAYYFITEGQWAACARIGNKAIDPLLSVLADRAQMDSHGQVIWALGQIGEATACNTLARILLEDPRPEIRRMAAEALGNIGDGQALTPLLKAHQDRSEAVQYAATNAIERLNVEGFLQDISLALQSKKTIIRQKGVALAGRLSKDEALPLLDQALRDPHLEVRLQAVQVLGQFGDKNVLAKALMDSDVAVRIMALRVYAQYEGPQGLAYIARAIDDEDLRVRKEAVNKLATSRHRQKIPALGKALADKEPTIRRLVVMALGEERTNEAIPYLRLACRDPHPEVRIAALKTFAYLNGETANEVILTACRDGDAQVRETAVGLLVNDHSEEALTVLLRAVKDGVPPIRETAIKALAKRREAAALEAIVDARWDEDYRVSKMAVLALSEFGLKALEPLQEALDDVRLPDQAAIKSLEIIGGPAINNLLNALKHNRLPARRAAANALARLLAAGELNNDRKKLILEHKETLAAYVDANLVGIFGNGMNPLENEQ